MKRVIIIHGWEASPESNWFPWLKNELEKKGIRFLRFGDSYIKKDISGVLGAINSGLEMMW
jgi:predicted alpha/beta hydrolase family esterase